MTAVTDEMVEKVRAVLAAEGADSEGGWHSWRCFDFDRVRRPESCNCTEQVARAALEAVVDDLADLIRTHDRARAALTTHTEETP